jgi:hypothetical protein
MHKVNNGFSHGSTVKSALYSQLARATRAPAPVLAEATGQPITTVHRWIKEARRRGFLAAGSAGKAG